MGFSMFSSQHSPIAIDFGSSSVKLLQIASGDRPAITAVAEIPVPDSAQESMESLYAFISEQLPKTLAKSKFKGKRCVISAPSSQTFIQHMQIPRTEGMKTIDEGQIGALPGQARLPDGVDDFQRIGGALGGCLTALRSRSDPVRPIVHHRVIAFRQIGSRRGRRHARRIAPGAPTAGWTAGGIVLDPDEDPARSTGNDAGAIPGSAYLEAKRGPHITIALVAEERHAHPGFEQDLGTDPVAEEGTDPSAPPEKDVLRHDPVSPAGDVGAAPRG